MTLTTEATEQDPPLQVPEQPRRRRKRVPAVLVVAALLGGGALYATQRGDETPAHDHGSHSHAPDLDPCTLVTAAEATAVLGPIGAPREGGLGVVGDQRVCVLPLERDVRFSANVGFTDFDVDSKYQGLTRRFEALAEPVPTLGEDSMWLEQFRLVLVLRGDELLSVQMSDVFEDPAASKDKAIKLALIAADRLPAAKDGS